MFASNEKKEQILYDPSSKMLSNTINNFHFSVMKLSNISCGFITLQHKQNLRNPTSRIWADCNTEQSQYQIRLSVLWFTNNHPNQPKGQPYGELCLHVSGWNYCTSGPSFWDNLQPAHLSILQLLFIYLFQYPVSWWVWERGVDLTFKSQASPLW